jgi:hypothetical protein
MMKKYSNLSMVLAIFSWVCFLILNSIFNNLSFYYFLLVPTLASFLFGVMSFYKITSKLTLVLSIASLILSITLGLLLGGMLLVGEILQIN